MSHAPADAYEDAFDEFLGDTPLPTLRTMPGAGSARIVVTVPPIEGFSVVMRLLRRAGAQEVTRRTWAVEGTLTIDEVVALMELARYRDGNSDGNQLDIRHETGT